MYDPATNSWSTKARPPFLGLDFGDAVSLEAKMYVIGFELMGTGEVGMATWVYSPLSNTWSQRTRHLRPSVSQAESLWTGVHASRP